MAAYLTHKIFIFLSDNEQTAKYKVFQSLLSNWEKEQKEGKKEKKKLDNKKEDEIEISLAGLPVMAPPKSTSYSVPFFQTFTAIYL